MIMDKDSRIPVMEEPCDEEVREVVHDYGLKKTLASVDLYLEKKLKGMTPFNPPECDN